MKTRLLVAGVIALVGCKKSGAPPAGQLGGERCAHIADLSDVMHCDIAPYASGNSTDEPAFRKALTQLRELAPSDPAFYDAVRPWPAIVDDMLQSRNYKQGCSDCHRRYQNLYKQRFEGSQIPWTEVHGPPADAAK